MIHTILSRIGCFFLLILLQALLFNHIHILGYATPLPYVYFLMILPNTTPRWVHILTGFGLGMAIDLFTGTPGMAASALCATGLLTTPLLKAFSPSDHEDDTFLPTVIINDGRVLADNLRQCGRDQRWLEKELHRQGIKRSEDVFLLTVDQQGTVICLRKEGAR